MQHIQGIGVNLPWASDDLTAAVPLYIPLPKARVSEGLQGHNRQVTILPQRALLVGVINIVMNYPSPSAVMVSSTVKPLKAPGIASTGHIQYRRRALVGVRSAVAPAGGNAGQAGEAEAPSTSPSSPTAGEEQQDDKWRVTLQTQAPTLNSLFRMKQPDIKFVQLDHEKRRRKRDLDDICEVGQMDWN